MNVDYVKASLLAASVIACGQMLSAAPSTAPEPQAAEAATSVVTATGVVVDESGEPLVGVSVSVGGKGAVGVTDMDGRFSVKVKSGQSLKFTYVGLTPETVKVPDNGQPMTVVLKEDSKVLSEVVVTALGIKRSAKALTYNVQEVTPDELTSVKDANFVNSLAGKVAGVNINTSAVGIGGGSKVVMRGSKSISGNNNALYVIDGVPMPSLENSQPADNFSGQGQSGDGASMINPEDIESMSVLSGAAASALYGSAAANGVIMITTKKGTADHTRVTYSNSTQWLTATATPEFQNTYGAATGEFASWGEKLSVASSYNPVDFFQTGYNETNAITVSTGNSRNQTFLSLAATNAEGIVNNNNFDRYNFTVRNTTQLIENKLRLDLGATYMNVREQNMVSQGQYMNPIVATYLMSPSYGLDAYKNYERYDESRGFKTQYWPWGNQGLGMQNPYWTTNRDKYVNHKSRYLLTAGLYWDNVIEGLDISGRVKVDNTDSRFETKYWATTDAIFANQYGGYIKRDDNTRQLYADAMAKYDRVFGPISLTAVLGASINDVRYNMYEIGGSLNSVANKFSLVNLDYTTVKPNQSNYHDQTQSLYSTIQLGFWSKIYLDLAGRIDWCSALGWTTSDNVAYPSVGLSGILTDIFPTIQNDVLSFLKVRAAYSEVGNAPTRYIAYQTYPFESGSPTTASTYPNNDIKPERTKAWELGLQSRFWMDKITLNVSLYKTSTYNQLFNPALSSGSGYSSIYINGGQVDNKGIEISLGVNQPLGPVQWNTNFTYTLNRNKIVKLLKPTVLSNGLTVSQDHLDIVTLGNVKSRLVEGGSIGDLYVTVFKRDVHGDIIVDYADNTVYKDDYAGEFGDGWVYAGNAEAKYTMGWRNDFRWNGFNLGFLINARVGGRCVSMTQAYMDAYGTSLTSAIARDNNGVMVNGNKYSATQKYLQFAGNNIGEKYVYSATNVRLGELTAGYDIPIHKWVNWIEGLNVSFTGRNLFFFYKKAPFDPELTGSTSVGMSGMDYFMLPSMRQLGFSVKATF
jgi:TonB-linked SusC/RagA family outer membrane protein